MSRYPSNVMLDEILQSASLCMDIVIYFAQPTRFNTDVAKYLYKRLECDIQISTRMGVLQIRMTHFPNRSSRMLGTLAVPMHLYCRCRSAVANLINGTGLRRFSRCSISEERLKGPCLYVAVFVCIRQPNCQRLLFRNNGSLGTSVGKHYYRTMGSEIIVETFLSNDELECYY